MDIAGPIRAYIEERFSPQEAKDAEEDLETLSLLRSEVVSASGSQTPEQRRETLLAYFRALSVVESRFPVSKQGGHVNLPFAWTDAFNSRKRAVVTATRFERAATMFNLGCAWSQFGCSADRDDAEGIKTAAHAFQHAAGAFATLEAFADRHGTQTSGDGVPSVDVSKECAGMLVALHLAQAQKCFFDKAAGDGKSAALLVKLAQQTHLFYEDVRVALSASPLKEHIDRSWAAHAEAMSALFHAEALSRACKDAEDDEDTIGPKIARLARASSVLANAKKTAKNTPGTNANVTASLDAMRDVVEEDLRRASRDNECVYMTKVPAYDDVPALGAAAVVKPAPPPPAALDASGETLFSKIVPESGFKALSKYTELVDAIIREETDVLASASDEARLALTEMELPELLFAASSSGAALQTPPGGAGDVAAGGGAGLPSPLDEEVAAVQSAGGVAGLSEKLGRLRDMHESCSQQVSAAENALDAEATEDDACRNAYGAGAWTRPASADLTRNLREKIGTFVGNLAQAARSDDSLRARVSDAAEGILSVLDPVNLATATPALRAPMVSTAEDGDLVATLRTALEDLEAVGAERAGIEDTMRQIKEKDNIMSKVMAKTCDDYEPLFAEELAKYDQVKGAIANNVSSQSDILSRLRDTHARFVSAYDVPGWRSAMASHAEVVRGAVAHYRELSSGIDRGLTFYSGFAQATQQLGADCEGFAANRRAEKRDLETAVAHRAQQAAAMAEHHAAASAAQHRAAADQAAAQRSFAEAQASMQAAQLQRQDSLQRASSFGAAPQPPPGVHVPQYAAPAPPPGVPTGPYAPHHASGYPQPPSPHAGHQYRAPIPAQPQMPYGAGAPQPPPPPQGSHMYPAAPYGYGGQGAPPPPQQQQPPGGGYPGYS